MIIRFGNVTEEMEKDILLRVAQASGGLLQVPVITTTKLLKSGGSLYFGDHFAFIAGADGSLKVYSVPTFPSRNRLDLIAEMAGESVPHGIRPYIRKQKQMSVPVSELLRHLCRCSPVLKLCPWLPEQVEALRTLESVV